MSRFQTLSLARLVERRRKVAQLLCLVSAFLWTIQPLRAALPPGWSDADIGSPGMAGSAGDTNGNWTVSGGGADIWGTADQFNYAYNSVNGDGSIIAEVSSLQNSDPGSGWSKAGIMFRNDTTAGAVNVAVVATYGNGVSFQWRSAANGGCNYQNATGLTAPVWIKLTRAGTSFSAFYSADGSNWTQVGATQTVLVNSNCLAGLAVTAHNNAALNTATFTNVTVAVQPPVVSAPVLVNLPANNVQPTSATLLGQVLSTGNQTPSVTLFYGPNDGGTAAAAWSNSVALGPQTSVFGFTVGGLATNTAYYYTAWGTNSAGAAWASPSESFTTPSSAPPVQPVYTYRYDNRRGGVDTNETQLTLANVNVNSFGKLFTYSVDGYVFAQPLIATNVAIPGKGAHDVLYVVTENDSVYAFDADAYIPAPYWTASFLGPGVTAVPGGDANGNIQPVVGITATPVIDPVTGTLYVEAFTKETSGTNVAYMHRLHALDMATGLERTNLNSPVVISCTNYSGTGSPGYNDTNSLGQILWNGLRETCRPALLLANGMIYLCYCDPGDHLPYYGWVFAYDAHTLAQTGVFNDDPNGGYGGIWMSGNGPVADTNGCLYLVSGNGTFDATNDFGDSYLKLNGTNGLKLVDYFTPYNQATMNSQDLDLGSSGLTLLPDSVGSAAHPHLLLGSGKTGTIYLIDRDNMGHYNPSGDTQIVQSLVGAVNGIWSTPTYFNSMFYVIGTGDHLKSFILTNATMGTTPTAMSLNTFGGSYAGGSTPCVSANGTNNAIVWALDHSSSPAVLYAYNATNVSQELYSSSQDLSRDNPGAPVQFTTPVVANGRVYVDAQYSVSVFGNASFIAAPVISPAGGVFTNSVTVTISNTAPGASIYYTTDGGTPTTNSTLYTGPFAITTTTTVRAIAAETGYVNSAVASASFVNNLNLPPPPWQTGDIGSVAATGSAYFSNGVFIVSGSGADIWNTADGFRFVYQPLTNDCDVSARVTSQGNTDPWAKAGVMIRDSLAANSSDALMAITPGNGFSFQYRSRTGISSDGNVAGGALNAAPNNWVRLARTNNAFTAYKSADGANWTQVGTATLSLSNAVYYVGLAVCSHNNGAISTATFDNVAVNGFTYSNPPPAVVLTAPAANSAYTAAASVTIGADAAALYDTISQVSFYANSTQVGSVSNLPYTVTATGLTNGSYSLTAVAVSSSGLMSTSAPVSITVAAGSGQPYGLTNRGTVPAFLNMPTDSSGSPPPLLSGTGVFSNTTNRTPAVGLIPYAPIAPQWKDNASSSWLMALPNNGGPITSGEQIQFQPTNSWTFPAGSVFVKNWDLMVNETNATMRRLETQILVRDNNGSVYGVTYKWRPDNSDADLLSSSLSENIAITNATGVRTQTWYYPSPSDCQECHNTAVAGNSLGIGVLGVSARELNGNLTYASTGVTDNQIRTLNRLGLLYPAINETNISGYARLSAMTNLSASLQDRVRSYLDVNCQSCHQPGGQGPTWDARYDTPLAQQNITNYPALFPLGISDNACIVKSKDIWRSVLLARMSTTNQAIQMPDFRNLIDTNAVQVITDWINSLPGTPALAPPVIAPDGGSFFNSASVTLQPPDTNAAIYYTLDGSLPTTNSLLYSGAFNLTGNATIAASAFETNYVNSAAASALFLIQPLRFTAVTFTNGNFQLQFLGASGSNYVFQASTNLVNWTPLATNPMTTNVLIFLDQESSNFSKRFYRALQQ